MRVLVSAGWLGGAGGAERALQSVVRALSLDKVDVVARQRLGGRLAQVGDHARLSSPLAPRWRYSAMSRGPKGALVRLALNPLRRQLWPRYDLYLQFLNGADLSGAIRARLKILIPSGQEVSNEIAAHFDYVGMQAPDNVAFVPDGAPTLLLPPPVYPVSDVAERPRVDIPPRFFLTVFNPYGAVKGIQELAQVADDAPFPIVWCHSRRTMSHVVPTTLLNHPNIVDVEDPTPEHLRYLYEHCLAYLAFSKKEGFGWAIADALRHSPAVVARRVGVLSFPEAEQHRVHLIDGDWSVDWRALPAAPSSRCADDLQWLSPGRFRGQLVDLLAKRSGS